MLDIREDKEEVFFKVRVQPRASKNQVVGIHDHALKLRLTAPPVDGEANEACRAYLAELLSVPRSRVEIVTGHTSRNKVVKVSGSNAGTILQILKVNAGVSF